MIYVNARVTGKHGARVNVSEEGAGGGGLLSLCPSRTGMQRGIEPSSLTVRDDDGEKRYDWPNRQVDNHLLNERDVHKVP